MVKQIIIFCDALSLSLSFNDLNDADLAISIYANKHILQINAITNLLGSKLNGVMNVLQGMFSCDHIKRTWIAKRTVNILWH